MGYIHDTFIISTKNGDVTITLGQIFRPNQLTKKIYNFQSKNGYTRWIMSVKRGVILTFAEMQESIETAMAMVGAVPVKDEDVREVA